MSRQEEQEAINALRRMSPKRRKLALIVLSNMSQEDLLPSTQQTASPPKTIAPVHLKLVSNSGR